MDHDEVLGTDFARLLKSGANEIDKWIVVLRSTTLLAHQDCERRLTQYEVAGDAIVVATSPCGISRARNEGLRTYFASKIGSTNDIVCFPDDDCHFERGFGNSVRERFSTTNADLAIMPYAPAMHLVDRTRWPLHLNEISPANLIGVTSSAGIFVRARSLDTVGGFDEQFGVGARLSAGEDVDFVLRASRFGLEICYWGDLAVLHEYKTQPSSRQVGNFALIRRHRDVLPPLAQVRALARMVQNLITHMGIRAFFLIPKSILLALTTSSTAVPLRRSIGGLQIETSDPGELIRRASNYAAGPGGRSRSVVAGHITSLNHAAVPAFRRAFNRADITMVDGISLSLISWLTPGPRLQKLATTDFAPAVFEMTAARLGRPVRVGIVGGQQDVSQQAASNLDLSPDVDVVYFTHGYWEDFAGPIAELNVLNPDILILGLGMPLEASWLQEHQFAIKAPLVITCGGWLRLIAQVESRAPRALQKVHLEWLWRLVTDPKRTTPRYSKGMATVAKSIIAPWSL